MNGTFRVNGNNLHFTCHFVTDSTAPGCLVISQSIDEVVEPTSLYKVVYKSSMTDVAVSSTLHEVPLGENRVYVYELKKTGLPGKYPAVNTSVVIVSKPQTNGKHICFCSIAIDKFLSTSLFLLYVIQFQM